MDEDVLSELRWEAKNAYPYFCGIGLLDCDLADHAMERPCVFSVSGRELTIEDIAYQKHDECAMEAVDIGESIHYIDGRKHISLHPVLPKYNSKW
jgi:hypothetical protein